MAVGLENRQAQEGNQSDVAKPSFKAGLLRRGETLPNSKNTENNKKYLAILPRSNKIKKPMKLKNAEDRAARIQSVKSRTTGAGKGDKPRPITSKYWDNYDQIDWKKK